MSARPLDRGNLAARGVVARRERAAELLVPALLALLAGVGWLGDAMGLAVVVAAQLAVGGLGTVHLLGPARPRLGFARYVTPAVTAVAATLFGRLLPPGMGLLLVPAAGAVIWAMLHLELRTMRGEASRTTLDLLLTAVLFAAGAGIEAALSPSGWPPPIVPVGLVIGALALRQAEARGRGGAHAIGQALLHALGVLQVALALALLDLRQPVAPAIVALAFYAWSGAADALGEGARGRAVALEFGSLAALGIVVALLLHGA